MDSNFKKTDRFVKGGDIPSELVGSSVKFDPKQTEFTIFIPTYKRAELLMNSFRRAVSQKTAALYEIVVCDDNADKSDLSSYQLVRQIFDSCAGSNVNFYYYRNSSNLGQIRNWNRGIELAHGRYLLMSHDDDWIDPKILENSRKYLSKSSGVAFQIKTNDFRKRKSFGQVFRFLGVMMGRVFSFFFFSKKAKLLSTYVVFLHYMNPGNCGVILSVDKLKELGGYDDEAFPFTDQYMFAFYAMTYGITYVKKRRAHYRIAQNDSLKTAKTFPAFRYRFLINYAPFVEGHSQEELKKKAIDITVAYVRDASIFWGVPLTDFDLTVFDFDATDPRLVKEANRENKRITWEAAKRYL
jgi:glycosyltransferase involved in cell wall biosynthesis